MAKKIGFMPKIILRDITPGDDTVIGGGTGQSTTDPFPCDFADWQTMFAEDYDLDEDIDFNDYATWWEENEFSMDDWDRLNPGTPFPEL